MIKSLIIILKVVVVVIATLMRRLPILMIISEDKDKTGAPVSVIYDVNTISEGEKNIFSLRLYFTFLYIDMIFPVIYIMF